MPLSLPLPSPHGHHYYETAQLAAFAVYVGLLLGQGYRRGYAARAWLPLVAAATLALVLGCQLVCLPLAQWAGWLHGDPDAIAALAGGPRSIIGGAWGVFLAVLVLRRPLGFRGWGVFDAFAGPLCWALAVQSVGCVLAGCCWGQATATGWGLAYGPGTPAYAAQLAQGLIGPAAAHTLALVPTQLLQLLACAGAGLVLHLLRHRRWAAGSRYLLGLGLLCLGRLVVEAWRDPAGEPLLGASLTLAGVSLRGLQWLMLGEVLVLLGGWVWLVRRSATPETAPTPHPAAPALVGLGLLLVTTRLAPATLAWAEVVTLQLLLLLVLLAEGRTWLVTLGRSVPRLAGLPLAALLGGVLLLGVAQAPAPQQNPQPEAGDGRQLTLSGGYLTNNFNDRPSGGCGSNPSVYTFNSQAAGVDAAYKWKADSAAGFGGTVGGGVWAGTQQGMGQYTATGLPAARVFDVHFYTERQRKWRQNRLLSYRVGLHFGRLGIPGTNSGTYTTPGSTGTYSYYGTSSNVIVLPELMLAYGSPWLFGQYDAGYGVENALGNYTGRVGLGTGFGRIGGNTLLLGAAVSNHYNEGGNPPLMPFASARLRLPMGATNGLVLEPYLATNFDQHYQFSVRLHYQLGLR